MKFRFEGVMWGKEKGRDALHHFFHHVVVTLFPLPLWVPVMIFDRILVLKTLYFGMNLEAKGSGKGLVCLLIFHDKKDFY